MLLYNVRKSVEKNLSLFKSKAEDILVKIRRKTVLGLACIFANIDRRTYEQTLAYRRTVTPDVSFRSMCTEPFNSECLRLSSDFVGKFNCLSMKKTTSFESVGRPVITNSSDCKIRGNGLM